MTLLLGRQAHRASGLLGAFAEAGVLEAADVHVARTLDRLSGAASDGDAELTMLAIALTVRAVRHGSVITDLATLAGTVTVDEVPLGPDGEPVVDVADLPWPEPRRWLGAVRSSPLVADGDAATTSRPLRLVGTTLALDRYWRHERRIVADLTTRAATDPSDVDEELLRAGLGRLFPGSPSAGPDLQRVAAAAAVLRSCTVIAGGPGTGKTTTVARILALLHEQAAAEGRPMRAALAAPTGKAAARLQEAVQEQAARLAADGAVEPAVADAVAATEAATLHRLLGWNPGNRSRFRHDRSNQLPHQVVVVDETSMVSLSMMARLLEAVRPSARLVLVGDPQQLASVEAGAVLGDVVGPAAERLRMRPAARTELEAVSGQVVDADEDDRPVCIGDGIVVLRHNHRFAGGIRDLAAAIQTGRADDVVDVLGRETHDVHWLPVDVAEEAVPAVRDLVVDQAAEVIEAATLGRAGDALAAMRGVQLLCAHRRGPYGVATWRREIERRLAETVPGFAWQGWFAGRPLLITENDRQLGLYNGDTGVVVDVAGDLRCAFERRGEVVHVSPSRLAAVETLYAMTIHKSQGSQFGEVIVVLPDETSPILTRELLYTAVTRAERGVTVVGTEAAVRAAVSRPVARASGLRDRLWDA
ncbi:exodeoxyribonuclease V subunit alpha [Acidimicrobiia bacterium EGI L10123]|uniref:exodeoxyribonuclease V subunit alpha n=1 Tax=Salinilacustrithrix flava TaxID=2957203 RepID=UPI003D7C216E|nr:exodeoxyribonuclease V subunit alpha [Acidimicrobiia bacterium EGI L10123]